MRIRIFDITWRIDGPNLPSVLEYDVVLETYLRKHPKHLGGPLRQLIHHAYFVNPVFFKYVLGNSHKIYTYEYEQIGHNTWRRNR